MRAITNFTLKKSFYQNQKLKYELKRKNLEIILIISIIRNKKTTLNRNFFEHENYLIKARGRQLGLEEDPGKVARTVFFHEGESGKGGEEEKHEVSLLLQRLEHLVDLEDDEEKKKKEEKEKKDEK